MFLHVVENPGRAGDVFSSRYHRYHKVHFVISSAIADRCGWFFHLASHLFAHMVFMDGVCYDLDTFNTCKYFTWTNLAQAYESSTTPCSWFGQISGDFVQVKYSYNF